MSRIPIHRDATRYGRRVKPKCPPLRRRSDGGRLGKLAHGTSERELPRLKARLVLIASYALVAKSARNHLVRPIDVAKINHDRASHLALQAF